MTLQRWFPALFSALRGLVARLRGWAEGPRSPLRHGPGTWRLPAVPDECPECGGALVHCVARSEYVCMGVIGRAEVERRLQARITRLRLKDDVTDVPPCGFAGKAADYGTKWA